MTQVSPTFLSQSFGWIHGSAMLPRTFFTASARNLNRNEPIRVPLICSYTASLNLKHLYNHISSGSEVIFPVISLSRCSLVIFSTRSRSVENIIEVAVTLKISCRYDCTRGVYSTDGH